MPRGRRGRIDGTRPAYARSMPANQSKEEDQTVVAEDACRRFLEIHGDSQPIRGRLSFENAVHAAGMSFSGATTEWLRSLDSDWVLGLNEAPFAFRARQS